MYVYILTNKFNTVLYTGVTDDLSRRVLEHREASFASFCCRYRLCKLVYAEEVASPHDAIVREKQLKGWRREKKEKLINRLNPEWQDLLRTR